MKESREQSRTTTHSCRPARPGGRGFGLQQPPRGRWAPITLVSALVIMIVVLVGCKIEIALDTKVSADGSGSIGVRLAADKEIQDLMAQQATEGDLFAEFKKQIPADWQTDSGTDADGTKWVSASKSFQDTAELDALLAGQAQGGLGGALAGDTFSITQSRSLFSVTTTFDATWDAGKALADAQAGITDTVTPDMLSSVFLVENRLTLPGIIKDNNATEVQGNTLIWRPSLQGATPLHARSVAVRWDVVGVLIAVGALLVVVVVVVAVLLLTRGRRRARVPADGPAAETPASPAAETAVSPAVETEAAEPAEPVGDVPPDAPA
jgi:hypothetical protein